MIDSLSPIPAQNSPACLHGERIPDTLVSDPSYDLPDRKKHWLIVNGWVVSAGGLTMNVAFNRPELFRYIGIMSSGAQNADVSYPDFFKDPAAKNKRFKLLWIAVGKDDALAGRGSKALDEVLTKHGIDHTYLVTEGRHEWTVWRYHLRNFAPLFFR